MTEADPEDPLKDNYGDDEMVQSKTLGTKTLTRVEALDKAMSGQQVRSAWVRARVCHAGCANPHPQICTHVYAHMYT